MLCSVVHTTMQCLHNSEQFEQKIHIANTPQTTLEAIQTIAKMFPTRALFARSVWKGKFAGSN